ncbi:MAG: mechanosensitive ion channel [Deltaproteobacteria bacterium]|nr:mechanosensitive ion channel [Deltaproteobacteria bacterium]
MKEILISIIQWSQGNGSKIVSVAVILILTIIVYSLASGTVKTLLHKRQLALPVINILVKFIRWICVGIGGFIILAQLGILNNVWAALLGVLAAVSIGFVAGWSIISNMFCFLLILVYKPYKIGDTIEIPVDTIIGRAIDLNLMYTVLEDEKSRLINVPNNSFFTKAVIISKGESDISLFEQFNSDIPFKN